MSRRGVCLNGGKLVRFDGVLGVCIVTDTSAGRKRGRVATDGDAQVYLNQTPHRRKEPDRVTVGQCRPSDFRRVRWHSHINTKGGPKLNSIVMMSAKPVSSFRLRAGTQKDLQRPTVNHRESPGSRLSPERRLTPNPSIQCGSTTRPCRQSHWHLYDGYVSGIGRFQGQVGVGQGRLKRPGWRLFRPRCSGLLRPGVRPGSVFRLTVRGRRWPVSPGRRWPWPGRRPGAWLFRGLPGRGPVTLR